ncbi:hypothetical protein HDV00_005028 [Rhizophlyctis rosea]|nr:hypothetical protein HDV00_005028 [Rhizophlyctis rosea]
MLRARSIVAFGLLAVGVQAEYQQQSQQYQQQSQQYQQQPQQYSVPKECIPIDKTNSCAPWSTGYYINATELGLVYGLKGPIPDAAYWDKLIHDTTSGGKMQAQMWKDWAQCTGYNGELIQYSRSYNCLTDIHWYSQGCNAYAKPVNPPTFCTGVCEAYGTAVKKMIDNTKVCPKGMPNQLLSQYSERRSHAVVAAQSCDYVLQGLGGSQSQCTYGVGDDHTSCGFSGDQETAKAYCQQYPKAACCTRLNGGSYTSSAPSSAPTSTSSNSTSGSNTNSTTSPKKALILNSVQSLLHQNAQASAASDDATGSSSSSGGQSWAQQNQAALIGGGIAVGIVVVAGVAVGVIRARRRSAAIAPRRADGTTPLVSSARGGMQQVGGGMVGVGVVGGPGKEVKYKVIHEYAPALPDELELIPGDMVELKGSYDDGWGKGRNLRSGLEGTFPMACIEAI